MSRFQVLSDAQWSMIADMLPRPTGRKGRPFADARTMVEAIIYRYRTGIAWRDLPEVFGLWQTVWTWHRRMAADGTWDRVLERLTAAADEADQIDRTVSEDSTIAPLYQKSTNICCQAKGKVELHESTGRSARSRFGSLSRRAANGATPPCRRPRAAAGGVADCGSGRRCADAGVGAAAAESRQPGRKAARPA